MQNMEINQYKYLKSLFFGIINKSLFLIDCQKYKSINKKNNKKKIKLKRILFI
jgi:hypothetical protein